MVFLSQQTGSLLVVLPFQLRQFGRHLFQCFLQFGDALFESRVPISLRLKVRSLALGKKRQGLAAVRRLSPKVQVYPKIVLTALLLLG
jgi:hypothetical protein